MSPADALMVTTMRGFPRVSGDEPFLQSLSNLIGVFSPRERG